MLEAIDGNAGNPGLSFIGESPETLCAVALAEWQAGRKRKSVRLLQEACINYPETPLPWEWLGSRLLELGNVRGAIDALEHHYLPLAGESASGGSLAALGSAWMVNGNFAAGESYLRLALEKTGYDRARSDILSNLSICQARRGDLEGAERSVILALSITPRHRDALYNRGMIQEAQGRRMDALNSYRDVAVLDPKMRAAQKSLGVLAKGFSQWEESELAWARTLRMTPEDHPEFAMVARNYCDMLLRQSKSHMAENLIYKLMAMDPGNGHRLLKVRMHVDKWEFWKAKEECARLPLESTEEKLSMAYIAAALGDRPLRDEMVKDVADCAKKLRIVWGSSKEEEKEAMMDPVRRYLENPKAGDEIDEMAGLYMATGEWLHRKKRYAEAFGAFTRGHKLMSVYENNDGEEAIREKIERQMEMEVHAAEREEGPRLVFIVGMPRSGTTLAEQIFDCHSQIVGVGESFASNFAAQMFLHNQDPVILRMRGMAYRSEAWQEARDRLIVIDKMPHNFQYGGILARLYPEAKFIWARRDPVDVCMSIFSKHFKGKHQYAHSLKTLGEHYRWQEKMMFSWMREFPDRFRELRYDRLVADLKGEIGGILNWIGLEWEDSCEDFHRNSRAVRTASAGQVNQPLYRSEGWRMYDPWLVDLKEALGFEGLSDGGQEGS